MHILDCVEAGGQHRLSPQGVEVGTSIVWSHLLARLVTVNLLPVAGKCLKYSPDNSNTLDYM